MTLLFGAISVSQGLFFFFFPFGWFGPHSWPFSPFMIFFIVLIVARIIRRGGSGWNYPRNRGPYNRPYGPWYGPDQNRQQGQPPYNNNPYNPYDPNANPAQGNPSEPNSQPNSSNYAAPYNPYVGGQSAWNNPGGYGEQQNGQGNEEPQSQAGQQSGGYRGYGSPGQGGAYGYGDYQEQGGTPTTRVEPSNGYGTGTPTVRVGNQGTPQNYGGSYTQPLGALPNSVPGQSSDEETELETTDSRGFERDERG